MAAKLGRPEAWMPVFLAAMRDGAPVAHAAAAAGVSPGTTYYHRSRNRQFAADWRAACTPANPDEAVTAAPEPLPGHHAGWRAAFFEALAESSNLAASARQAGVPLRTVYKTRRKDPGFAARWLAALHEGYDNLEMELLGHLRDPNPRRRMDVAAALRLLAAHRATVERRRALSAEDDEQATVESLDRFIEDMRQRRLANSAILIGCEAGSDDDDGAP